MKYHGNIINIFSLLIIPMYFTKNIQIDKNFYMPSTSHTLSVISELPSQNDVYQYIGALRLLVRFLAANTKCLDFGMKFGLFLLNVNLRSFLQNEVLIPSSLRKEIRYLVEESDQLHKHFDRELSKKKLREPANEDYNNTEMYLTMLIEDTAWSSQILRFDLDLLKEVYSYSYEFPEWNKYANEIEDLSKWIPSLKVPNACLGMLAYKKEVKKDFPLCNLSQNCLQMLNSGNNLGYVLCFKLLFLLLARLSRGCTVFSTLQDVRVRHQLCKSAYRESEYIAENNFKRVDIMAEHICYCALDGHAQFLRTSWLSQFLRHQTPYGYFTPNISSANLADIQGKYEKRHQNPIVDDTCLEHINAVMVGAFSAAIRFILENYH